MVNSFQGLRVEAPSFLIDSQQPFGELTIGEQETKLITVKNESDFAAQLYAVKGGVCYPNVRVPHDLSQTSRPKMRQLLKTRDDQQTPTTNTKNQTPLTILIKAILHFMQVMAFYIPFLQDCFPVRIPAKLSKTQQQSNNSDNTTVESGDFSATSTSHDEVSETNVCAFDWHPTLMKFACALKDGGVYFYDLFKEEWSNQVLRHDFHRDISSIRWRPGTKDVVAVACKYGICLWYLNKRIVLHSQSQYGNPAEAAMSGYGAAASRMIISKSDDESSRSVEQRGICIFLRVPGFHDFSCMEWSPDGDMLVLGSAKDNRMVVWQEVEGADSKWKYQFLEKRNGGIVGLSFSPNGRFLASFTNTNVFRIWETTNWTSEKWSTSTWSKLRFSPVKSYQWTHNSNYLLVSLKDHSSIHVIKVEGESPSVGGEHMFEIDLKAYNYVFQRFEDRTTLNESSQDEEDDSFVGATSRNTVRLCGHIKNFVIDNQGFGERIVVAFEDTEYLAVIRCDFDSMSMTSKYLPVGYIRGGVVGTTPGKARAVHMGFWAGFKKGALLAVCWSNGQIAFYPFYFNTENGWDTLENTQQVLHFKATSRQQSQ